MAPEQKARFALGWSHERLAAESGVSVASVYLLERMETAGSEDDARIREALVFGLTQRSIKSCSLFAPEKNEDWRWLFDRPTSAGRD